MPLKFVTVNGSVFQLLGRGLLPPDPLPGLRPWTPLGDFNRPTDPLSCAVLKFPLKIPWSVCLSVCLSVTRWYCVRTAQVKIMKSSLVRI